MHSFSALTLLVRRHEGHPACKKTEWWAVGVVVCLEWGADLHTAQLMPLPLIVSCFSKLKSRLVLPFWYRLTRVVPEKGPLNGCVCVCWHLQSYICSTPLAIHRYLLSVGCSAANLLAAIAAVDRWDRRMDTRLLRRPCSAYCVSRVNNLMIRDVNETQESRVSIFTAWCYASAVLATGLCLSVCHESEFY